MKKELKMEILKLDDFEVMFFNSTPPRIEAKIEFDKNHISQKLIFTLMDITYSFGIGCSPPNFGDTDDDTVFFLLGMFVNSKKYKQNQLKRMNECLLKIVDFAEELNDQVDFSNINISMFDGSIIGDVERLSIIRDQSYQGSWDNFYKVLVEDGYEDAAEMILMLKEFEEVNNKNVGFVGHKLSYLLSTLLEEPQKNTVLN